MAMCAERRPLSRPAHINHPTIAHLNISGLDSQHATSAPTSNCTAHGAWLQNAAIPQRPATPTLRLVLIIVLLLVQLALPLPVGALYCLISRSSSAGLSLSISS